MFPGVKLLLTGVTPVLPLGLFPELEGLICLGCCGEAPESALQPQAEMPSGHPEARRLTQNLSLPQGEFTGFPMQSPALLVVSQSPHTCAITLSALKQIAPSRTIPNITIGIFLNIHFSSFKISLTHSISPNGSKIFSLYLEVKHLKLIKVEQINR